MAFFTTPSATLGSAFGRSFSALVPNDWRSDRSYPLLLCLHSYGSTGAGTLANFGLNRANNFDDGYIILAPDAGTGSGATRAWKYWDTAAVDEFAFLSGIITEAQGRFNISRVHGIGYSNGGFMLTQLAQAYLTVFSSIAIFAAADGTNDSVAALATPLPILYVYSDLDGTVLPAGDAAAATLPGILNGHGGVGSAGYVSKDTMPQNWATRNGLGGSLGAEGTAFDLVTTGTPAAGGAETYPADWAGSTSTNRVTVWREDDPGHSGAATLSSGRGSYPLFQWLITNHR